MYHYYDIFQSRVSFMRQLTHSLSKWGLKLHATRGQVARGKTYSLVETPMIIKLEVLENKQTNKLGVMLMRFQLQNRNKIR